MKKIVCVLRPFTMAQNIFVYEDGNKIEVTTSTLDKINDALVELVQKHSINEIELVGSKMYAKGIQNKIEKAELTKYNTNNISIKII